MRRLQKGVQEPLVTAHLVGGAAEERRVRDAQRRSLVARKPPALPPLG